MSVNPNTGVDYKVYPVLLVDDEEDILDAFRLNYRLDFTVLGTTSPREALSWIESESVAVLIADQRMPEMTGVETIKRALDIRPGLIPIILSGYADTEALVRAINIGRIYRYIPKPWNRGELRDTVAQAIETYHLLRTNAGLVQENGRLIADLERANERLRQENRFLKDQQADPSGFSAIVGESAALRRVLDRARRVVDVPTTVLIEGATGTGKELVARAIHYAGPQRDKLFVAVNTATLTDTLLASTLFGHRRGAFTGATRDHKGLFEIADGGTLFLDEIGDTSPIAQAHLLRVLQEGEVLPIGATRAVPVEVRVIVATNRDLEEQVRCGQFREDLLHRLSVFPLRLPSLDERREDIPQLAEHFLARQCRKLRKSIRGFEADALRALMNHHFRGNVRELDNLIERAIILCEPDAAISVEDLFDRGPDQPATPDEADDTLHAKVVRFEQDHIRQALDDCGGNKSAAARKLGLTYHGLLKKMQRYQMLGAGAEPDA